MWKKSQILNQTLTLAAVDSEGEQFDAQHYIIAEQIDSDYLFGAIIIKLINWDIIKTYRKNQYFWLSYSNFVLCFLYKNNKNKVRHSNDPWKYQKDSFR